MNGDLTLRIKRRVGRRKAEPRGMETESRFLPSATVSVRVAQRFNASPDRVFSAWVDPGTAPRWLFATASRPATRASIDARAGGSFCFVERRDGAELRHAGRYLEMSRPTRLVFTLSGSENGRTRVTVAIAPARSGSEVTVVHESLPREQADQIAGRWCGMLYGLGSILDNPRAKQSSG
jgi:uncharacterized protein YndB with AHSA1/START domain